MRSKRPSNRPPLDASRDEIVAQKRTQRPADLAAAERSEFFSSLLEATEQQIDALDGWRDWADGKAIADGMVIDITHTLSAEARTNDRRAHAALADVIHRWAQAKGLDLSRSTPTIERAGIEIDL